MAGGDPAAVGDARARRSRPCRRSPCRPGGEAQLAVTARAPAGAAAGDNYGFVVLRRGDVDAAHPVLLRGHPAGAREHAGDAAAAVPGSATRSPATSRVSQYRWPSRAVRPAARLRRPADAPGRRRARSTSRRLGEPVDEHRRRDRARRARRARIDPWVLGSKDENDVQGARRDARQRQPPHVRLPASTSAPRARACRGRRRTTSPSTPAATSSRARSIPVATCCARGWTTSSRRSILPRHDARLGRPADARRARARRRVRRAGVRRRPAVARDRRTQPARRRGRVRPAVRARRLPAARPACRRSARAARATSSSASDLQESKNVNTTGDDVMPNTALPPRSTCASSPADRHVARRRSAGACAARQRSRCSSSPARASRCARCASSTARGRSRPTAAAPAGLYSTRVADRRSARKGRHQLRAVVDRRARAHGRRRPRPSASAARRRRCARSRTTSTRYPLPPGHRFPLPKYRLVREAAERLAGVELLPGAASDLARAAGRRTRPPYLARVRSGALDRREQLALGLPVVGASSSSARAVRRAPRSRPPRRRSRTASRPTSAAARTTRSPTRVAASASSTTSSSPGERSPAGRAACSSSTSTSTRATARTRC